MRLFVSPVTTVPGESLSPGVHSIHEAELFALYHSWCSVTPELVETTHEAVILAIPAVRVSAPTRKWCQTQITRLITPHEIPRTLTASAGTRAHLAAGVAKQRCPPAY